MLVSAADCLIPVALAPSYPSGRFLACGSEQWASEEEATGLLLRWSLASAQPRADRAAGNAQKAHLPIGRQGTPLLYIRRQPHYIQMLYCRKEFAN